MKSPLTQILHYLEQSWGITIAQVESADVLGKSYKVIKGTIRAHPDYDDAWLFALAQDARVVFDIGCNIGQSALLILHTNKVEEILLVDPNPIALGTAAQNLINNSFIERSRLVCAFVSDKAEEQISFYTTGRGAASSMYATHAETASKLSAKTVVSTTTVDLLVEIYGLQPDLVKIDTEGAERLVLQGASQLAEKGATRFIVEMHSNSELSMRDNAQAVLDWCRRVNYKAWYLMDKSELTSAETIARRGRCHLLLLPDGKDFPDNLKHIEQGCPLNTAWQE